MSKRINVNPDHYKVAGRERQGEDVVHPIERRMLARLRRQERLIHPFAADSPDQFMYPAKASSPRATADDDSRGARRRAQPKRAAKGKGRAARTSR